MGQITPPTHLQPTNIFWKTIDFVENLETTHILGGEGVMLFALLWRIALKNRYVSHLLIEKEEEIFNLLLRKETFMPSCMRNSFVLRKYFEVKRKLVIPC